MPVNFTPHAEADLSNIWDYTEERWGSSQAKTYITEIQAACEGLISGRLKPRSAEHVRQGYLKYAVGQHMLFFKQPDPGFIEVIRILHQRQDVEGKM